MGTRLNTWKRLGFLDIEAVELTNFSSRALHEATYAKRMIAHRRAILGNARRYHWTPERYEQAIRADYMKRIGTNQITAGQGSTIWQYVRRYEDDSIIRGNEFDSGKIIPQTRKAQRAKENTRRTTRRDLYNGLIREIDKQLANPNLSATKRAEYEQQKKNLTRQLNS